MSQHDYVIANGTGAAVRSDLNNALAAIVSNNSGATEPATMYAYQWWADTTTGLLKLRNAANNAWITLFQLDGEWSTLAVENGSAAAPSIYFKDSGTDTGIYSPGTDQVAISTNGSGRLFIDSSGNVGVGVSPVGGTASYKSIEAGARGCGFLANTNGFDFFTSSNSYFDGAWKYGANGGAATRLDLLNGVFVFNTAPVNSGSAGAAATFTERMRLTSTGLGIGTTSPGYPLTVNGRISYAGAIGEGADTTLSSASTNVRIAESSTWQSVSVFTNGSERLRCDSSGRLLVGTSSAVTAAGGALFQLTQNQANWIHYIANTGSSGNVYGQYIQFSGQAPNNTTSLFFTCQDSSAERLTIRSNGGIANYSANNTNLSDRNAKKDISPAAGTWDCIKEWEIVNYRYKDQPDDAALNLGVIAQQVAESCPEVITVFSEAKDAKPAVLGDDGNEVEPAQEAQPERLGVKEQQMYWMAIKALQEAQVRIEALEAEVAALKAQ